MNYWSRFNEATALPSLLLGMKYFVSNFAQIEKWSTLSPSDCLLRTLKHYLTKNRSFKDTSRICCRSKLFSGERAAGTMPYYLLLGWFLPADGLLKGRGDAATGGLRLSSWTNDITARGCGPARRPCHWRRKALRDSLLQERRWVLSVDYSSIQFYPIAFAFVR